MTGITVGAIGKSIFLEQEIRLAWRRAGIIIRELFMLEFIIT